jgi:hypothetical protein
VPILRHEVPARLNAMSLGIDAVPDFYHEMPADCNQVFGLHTASTVCGSGHLVPGVGCALPVVCGGETVNGFA